MENGKVKLKKIDQVCVVVKNLQKTVENYWNILGIGPWTIYTVASPELTDATFRGRPENFTMKLAFADAGGITLEVIQPLKGQSVYKEFLEEKGEGLNHIASYKIEDMDKTLALLKRQGIDCLQSGKWGGATFAYVDTEKVVGAIIELVSGNAKYPEPEATYP